MSQQPIVTNNILTTNHAANTYALASSGWSGKTHTGIDLATAAQTTTLSLQRFSKSIGDNAHAPLVNLVDAARDVYYAFIEDLDEEDLTHIALLEALNTALEPFE